MAEWKWFLVPRVHWWNIVAFVEAFSALIFLSDLWIEWKQSSPVVPLPRLNVIFVSSASKGLMSSAEAMSLYVFWKRWNNWISPDLLNHQLIGLYSLWEGARGKVSAALHSNFNKMKHKNTKQKRHYPTFLRGWRLTSEQNEGNERHPGKTAFYQRQTCLS